MAGSHPPEGLGDDLFEQILVVQPGGYGSAGGGGGGGGGGQVVGSNMPLMGLQLGSSSGGGLRNDDTITMGLMPLGLNLEHHGFLRQQEDAGGALDNNSSSNNVSSSSAASGINERDAVHMSTLSPAFGQLQTHSIRPALPPPPPQTRQEREAVHMSTLFPAFAQLQTYSVRPALPPPLPGLPQTHQPFHGQPTAGPASAVQHPPAIRQRVRARRGQATDPHSIAERLRRERIAGRMKALQELVPTTNKTDRAAMLDEIVEYVKFLRLQVKVLSMSRLGAAGAVAQLMADLPLASLEGEGVQGGANQQAGEKWSNDGTEEQVAKLMETDVGAAMQFLQSKSLCMMPISLASAIFQAHPPDTSSERGQA